MSTIVTRAGKGSPLTNTEVDTNFTNLNTDKLEKDGSNLASKVSFDTAAALTPTTGQITWDADTGTVDIGLAGATAPVMSVGEDQFYRVINQTGSTIAKGTLVMAAGTVGNSGKIKVAAWNGAQPSKTIMGLTMAAIPTEVDPTESGLGYVLAFGKVTGIQTNGGNYGETWVNGDIIYAGASSGLTNVLPAAPNTKTTIAIVISAHATNGTLFVRPSYGSNLGEDELVQLASLANGDTLIYNSTNSRFENTAFPAGGLTFVVKTANYTTQDKEGVLADTSGGSFPVTLPSPPTTGAQVVVADSGNAWGTNNLTVGRNGSLIGGLAENLVCDITGASVQFVYDGSTWEVYAQIGGSGGTNNTDGGFANSTYTAPQTINGGTA